MHTGEKLMCSMHDELLIVTMDDWRQLLKSTHPVAVEFFLSTCPSCAKLTPIFRKLASEYDDRIVFGLVNARKSRGIADGYGIMGVPTVKFFCDGRPVYEIVGYRSEEELRVEIEKVLQTHKKCISQSSRLYV